MIDHYHEVAKAHESDDLLFGTVESWIAYVSRIISSFLLPNGVHLVRISLAVSRMGYTFQTSRMPLVPFC